MKHPLRAAALAAGALLCFSVDQAFADLELVNVAGGGSWYATLTYTGVRIDYFTVTWQNGELLEPPTVIDNFVVNVDAGAPPALPPSWSQGGPNPTTTTFSSAIDANAGPLNGGRTTSLTFRLHFQGDLPTDGEPPLTSTLKFQYFNGLGSQGGVNDNHRAVGSDNVILTVESGFATLQSVPVPAALWTALPMLGGMFFLIRRKRNVLA